MTTLSFVTEHRFKQTPDGIVWTQSAFSYNFTQRYLSTFESVCIIARVEMVQKAKPDWIRANGMDVNILPIPHYIGPSQYLLKAYSIRQVVRKALINSQAVILRIPSNLAIPAIDVMLSYGHPYGVEVVGDPYTVFAPGIVEHPLRSFFRWWFTHNQRQQCKKACAVTYVSKYLQLNYPTSLDAFHNFYTDVELYDEAFISSPKLFDAIVFPVKLIMVGSLEQMYKGPDILIEAVHLCHQRGFPLQLTLVGDGKYRTKLETQVAAFGLSPRIKFIGMLSAGRAVRDQLDQADIFVLPSRTEGLPRAMLEAMARGLPCIGSAVGGIPELLLPEDMVMPGDAQVLANKIIEVITNPARMNTMSARNLQKAHECSQKVLDPLRIEFYQHVRTKTEEWLLKQVTQ